MYNKWIAKNNTSLLKFLALYSAWMLLRPLSDKRAMPMKLQHIKIVPTLVYNFNT